MTVFDQEVIVTPASVWRHLITFPQNKCCKMKDNPYTLQVVYDDNSLSPPSLPHPFYGKELAFLLLNCPIRTA